MSEFTPKRAAYNARRNLKAAIASIRKVEMIYDGVDNYIVEQVKDLITEIDDLAADIEASK